MDRIFGIIIGLLVLSLMLVIHEAGHFFVGRKLGFTVVEFSIFMGPRIFSRVIGGVRYSIRSIPLGASVEFLGELDESRLDENGNPTELTDEEKEVLKRLEGQETVPFHTQAIWKRALTMLAGPFANLISATLAFILLFSISGFNTTEIASIDDNSLAANAQISAGEQITSIADYNVNTDLDYTLAQTVKDLSEPFTITTEDESGNENSYTITPSTTQDYVMGITFTEANGNASVFETNTDLNPESSKLMAGDQILAINGTEITATELAETLESVKGTDPIQLTILRGDNEIEIDYQLAQKEVPMNLGINLDVNDGWAGVIPYSFQYQWSYIKGTGAVIGSIFTGQVAANESLTGPIGIVDTLSTVVSGQGVPLALKLLNLLSIFSVISLALGMANLLPIIPMDGGQLMLLLIEKIRGKRLSPKVENAFYLVGMLIVLALFIMAFVFDIGRIFG